MRLYNHLCLELEKSVTSNYCFQFPYEGRTQVSTLEMDNMPWWRCPFLELWGELEPRIDKVAFEWVSTWSLKNMSWCPKAQEIHGSYYCPPMKLIFYIFKCLQCHEIYAPVAANTVRNYIFYTSLPAETCNFHQKNPNQAKKRKKLHI